MTWLRKEKRIETGPDGSMAMTVQRDSFEVVEAT
jgi:hypothetical protein